MNLPKLIYGTAWKKERTAELVKMAVVHGFRGIDTACQPKHYHEAGVGDALTSLESLNINRKSLFIQTKFTPLSGQDSSSVPYDPRASIGEQVRQSFQASLKNLRVDYLDALLLHSPLSRHEQTMEAWRAMEELHEQGVVHKLGISNCYEPSALKKIFDEAKCKPSIIQNRFYAQTDYDKIVRRYCGERHISYQGFWTLTANPHILKSQLLVRLADDKGLLPAQVFFRFLTQLGLVPLIGTCSEQHMQEDLAIFDFTLTDEEMTLINGLL